MEVAKAENLWQVTDRMVWDLGHWNRGKIGHGMGGYQGTLFVVRGYLRNLVFGWVLSISYLV